MRKNLRNPFSKVNILATFNKVYFIENKRGEFAVGIMVRDRFVCEIVPQESLKVFFGLKDAIYNARKSIPPRSHTKTQDTN